MLMKSFFLGTVALVAICMLGTLPGTVQAAFVGDIDGNTVTATAGSTYPTEDPAAMVNGAGMSDNPVLMTSTIAVDGDGSWKSDNVGGSLIPRWLLFTFDNNTSFNEMIIWNHNQDGYTAMGLKDVTITYSTGVDDTGLGNTLWSGTLTEGSALASQGYTDALSVAAADVKAVKIAYTTNYYESGDPLWCSTHFALGEVRFVHAELIPGDANTDGTVDAADAATLATNWQTSGANWNKGDFNNDGVVDDIDATLLATNWQTTTAGASVPEPGLGVLLLTALLFMFFRRSR